MEVTKAQQIMANLLRKHGFRVAENLLLPGGEADLCLEDYKVIVELDGFFHLNVKTQELDDKKKRVWEQEGYRVFRFTNDEVYHRPEDCLNQVDTYVRAFKKATKTNQDETPLKNNKKLEAISRQLKAEEKKRRPIKAGHKRHPEAYFLSLSGEEDDRDR